MWKRIACVFALLVLCTGCNKEGTVMHSVCKGCGCAGGPAAYCHCAKLASSADAIPCAHCKCQQQQ